MAWLKVGFFAILPFLAAAGGVLFGGWLSDKLLKATGSANLARKLPIVVGLMMASSIISANWLPSDPAVILMMSFAFFGQGYGWPWLDANLRYRAAGDGRDNRRHL